MRALAAIKNKAFLFLTVDKDKNYAILILTKPTGRKGRIMRQIDIDDEVFAYLQSQALAFVDTPNLTLRRLFLLDKPTKEISIVKQPIKITRKKKPKASLATLISSGLLKVGQPVFLVDYQDNKLTQYKAVINGSTIKWQGKSYSMSDLASQLLQNEGFSSSSVRGPAHWCTEDGVSIKNLWQQHLSSISNQHLTNSSRG